MDQIDIVFITDNNYLPYGLTSIYSLLENTRKKTRIHCLLTDISSETVKETAKEINKKYPNTTFKFKDFDSDLLSGITPKLHISRAAYAKIFISEYFSFLDKVIFLDSDIIVRNDISDLWALFKNVDSTVSAVWNPGYNYDNKFMGLAEDVQTFNSGVMLLDLKKMRKNQDSEKLMEFIEEKNHLTSLNDQAAFNAVFARQWTELPLTWNVQYKFFLENYESIGIELNELKKIRENPSIVHFTTDRKPWMYRSAHPYKKEFISYYKLANGEFKTTDFSFRAIVRKIKEIILLRKASRD